MALKRQLTYYIPLEIMCRTSSVQDMITKEAVNVNGQCRINYESLYTYSESFSIMVMTMVVDSDKCDYLHRAMQKVIALALSIYSTSTEDVRVTDEPVMTRDFNAKEIL